MAREVDEVITKKGYKVTEIGRDAIAVIVNKENMVKRLSLEQLKKIFGGAIKDWKEVGRSKIRWRTMKMQ